MARLSAVLRSLEGDGLAFWCPGCECMHRVLVGNGSGPRWQYNGNPDKPTFEPSIRVRWNEGEERVEKVCHSFVRDGQIQFLGDCTHALAGQTVSLPENW